MTINYTTPAQVFDAAESASVNFGEAMMQLPIRTGQRGDGFDRVNGGKKAEAAHKAVQRVLDIIYPPSDLPSGKTKAKQPDPVTQLLNKFNNLTAAQKKRFLAGV